MEFSQIKSLPLDKIIAMFAAHDEYVRLKNELLAETSKTTKGKANVGSDNIDSALEWLVFAKENPEWLTKKLNVAEFEQKADKARLLKLVQQAELTDQATTKAIFDVIAPDLRHMWTTTEGFYDEAAAEDSLIKEKYKNLPSISPKRKSETQIENDYRKLEAKRNKKNGITPPTD